MVTAGLHHCTQVTMARARYGNVQRRLSGPLTVVIVAVGVLLLSKIGYIQNAEHWTADWRTALFSTRNVSQHDSVALVLITDATLDGYPVRIPMDRHMLAKLVRTVASARPSAIGIDFVFVRPTDPAADADLLSAIGETDIPIVLASVDERGRLTARQLEYHREFLATAKRPTGHVFFERKTNAFAISEHVIREMAEPAKSADQQQSFAEVLAQIKRKGAKPHTPRIAWLLTPRDGSQTFYEVEASDLLGDPEDAAPLLPGLKDKIVLIGSDLVDLDRHLTPLSVVDEARMPGVKIHAHILAQLIDDRWLRALNWPEELLMLVAITLAGYTASRRRKLGAFKRTLASVGSISLVILGFVAFNTLNLVLPYTAALAAWLAALSIGPRSDRIRRKFAAMFRFVSANGGLRWVTYYRLGSTLGWRLWRGRL